MIGRSAEGHFSNSNRMVAKIIFLLIFAKISCANWDFNSVRYTFSNEGDQEPRLTGHVQNWATLVQNYILQVSCWYIDLLYEICLDMNFLWELWSPFDVIYTSEEGVNHVGMFQFEDVKHYRIFHFKHRKNYSTSDSSLT